MSKKDSKYWDEFLKMSESDVANFAVLQKYRELLAARLESDDIEYVIIKGHLYVDYIITKYISAFASDKVQLEGFRFTFHQKIGICKILGLFNNFPEFEKFLLKFNQVRNSIAHRLEYDEKLILEIIEDNKFLSGKFTVKNNTEKLGNIEAPAFVGCRRDFGHA